MEEQLVLGVGPGIDAPVDGAAGLARVGGAGDRVGHAGRELLVVVLHVLHHRHAELADVGDAGRLAGFLAGAREDGEEDGSQNSNDCYHHKQLDQGEAAPDDSHR